MSSRGYALIDLWQTGSVMCSVVLRKMGNFSAMKRRGVLMWISENSTWGIRRRFEQGKLHINHAKFLGYDKDVNGNLIINAKQAKTVRRIYREFLDGKSASQIAKDLEADGIPNWNGKVKWYDGNIKKMLSNEKYKGESLLQKTYTVDFLSKKRAENTGQVPQYYVSESHPAIIEKEIW